jgi:predicted enzyme related to lactoylglutathione lyase
MLVVRDVAAAAAFYRAAFGAVVEDGTIAIGAMRLRLVPVDRARGVLGPESFGGAPVVFALAASDPAATAAHAMANGAVLLRDVPGFGTLLRDPFLHLWQIDLPPEPPVALAQAPPALEGFDQQGILSP